MARLLPIPDMRPPSSPQDLEVLLSSCRAEPSLERMRDLVDRPDPPVQALLAEPWALPWLERLFDDDELLARTSSGDSIDAEWSNGSAPAAGAAELAPVAPGASFFAQSLLYALSHHPDSVVAARVGSVFLRHPLPELRLAACRTIERWGRADHEQLLRDGFVDGDVNVRRRALRAVMLRDVATAFDRIGASESSGAGDVTRLRDLLHVVGRDADRRFKFERVGFRDADERWLELALSHSKSKDRELRADAEYALLGAPKEAMEAAKARVSSAGKPPSAPKKRS